MTTLSHLRNVLSEIDNVNLSFAIEAKEMERRFDCERRRLKVVMEEVELDFETRKGMLENKLAAMNDEYKRTVESINEERALALHAHAAELETVKKYVAETLASLEAISLLHTDGEEEEEKKKYDRQQSANDGESVSSRNEGDDGVTESENSANPSTSAPSPPKVAKSLNGSKTPSAQHTSSFSSSNLRKKMKKKPYHDDSEEDVAPELETNSGSSSSSRLSSSSSPHALESSSTLAPPLPPSGSSKPRDLERHFDVLAERLKSDKAARPLIELLRANRQRHVASMGELLPTRLTPKKIRMSTNHKMQCISCGGPIVGARHYAGTEIDSESRCLVHRFCRACGEFIYCRFSDVCPGRLLGRGKCQWNSHGQD